MNDDGPFLVLNRSILDDGTPCRWYSDAVPTRTAMLSKVGELSRYDYEQEIRCVRISDVLKLPHLRVKPVDVEFEEVAGDDES